MPTHEIAQYILRTTDAPAATAFYDAVLGHHGDAVFPLHEQAVARGARPHWLGLVDTADPEGAASAFLAGGAERLGPRPGGGFVLRDPAGALIAFGPASAPSRVGPVWHVWRARHLARTAHLYSQAFGWSFGEADAGGSQAVSFSAGGPHVGTARGVEDEPGVHPQWLYLFGVAAFDQAFATALARGASMLPSASMPDGRRFAIGDDPQGAAFGLLER